MYCEIDIYVTYVTEIIKHNLNQQQIHLMSTSLWKNTVIVTKVYYMYNSTALGKITVNW